MFCVSQCEQHVHFVDPSSSAVSRVLTVNMAGRKSVCCGVSALELTLAVLFVLMTAVSVSLIAVLATRETATGEEAAELRHGHRGAPLCRVVTV